MPDFLAALHALQEGGVKFAVVGGLAAILNGAPVNTFDLDIVPARDKENIGKLLLVLDRLDAVYRMQPAKRIKPNASHLSSPGHHNPITNCGPLDVLGTIGRGLSFEGLLPHSTEMEIGGRVRVRVLDLATIVVLKEELAGEKDLAVLPILRRTLEEKRRGRRLTRGPAVILKEGETYDCGSNGILGRLPRTCGNTMSHSMKPRACSSIPCR